ncbi:MAG: TRAP transporter TatT component family protein [Gammaproteobacteria bacterium]
MASFSRPEIAVRIVVFAAALLTVCGCSIVVGQAVDNASSNLTTAILNQDDPETVRDGAPAYLLLMDSLVEGSPRDADILDGAASLYAAYAAVFVEDPVRAARLSGRALDYAGRAICVVNDAGCGLAGLSYEEVVGRLDEFGPRDVPALYTFGLSWLVYIRTHSEDWKAIADLPKVEALLDRLLELDEGYERGSVHAYLGVLKTLRPPALGGEPEEAREHFERAIMLSNGRDLSVKVEFARNYARLLYDRGLHDRLLNEVMETDPHEPGRTLMNTLAQRDAAELLASADDYF